jgi:hypothetical protein
LYGEGAGAAVGSDGAAVPIYAGGVRAHVASGRRSEESPVSPEGIAGAVSASGSGKIRDVLQNALKGTDPSLGVRRVLYRVYGADAVAVGLAVAVRVVVAAGAVGLAVEPEAFEY